MVSFFVKSAQSLIIAIIFVVIIEMIVPDGANKKYIKIVSGIYIIITVLNPFLSLINKDFEFDFKDSFNSIEVCNTSNIDYREYYLNSLIVTIKAEFKEKGFMVNDIELDLNEDYSEINRIVIKGCSSNRDDIINFLTMCYGVNLNNIYFI